MGQSSTSSDSLICLVTKVGHLWINPSPYIAILISFLKVPEQLWVSASLNSLYTSPPYRGCIFQLHHSGHFQVPWGCMYGFAVFHPGAKRCKQQGPHGEGSGVAARCCCELQCRSQLRACAWICSHQHRWPSALSSPTNTQASSPFLTNCDPSVLRKLVRQTA